MLFINKSYFDIHNFNTKKGYTMIYTVTTTTPLAQVKEELVAHSKESGFGVLGSYEFQKILQTKGFPIDKDITVYEVCNPSAAQEILQSMSAISVYLPCRLSVYEENGKTVLATINMKTVADSLDIDEELKSHIHSVYEYLENIMNSWN